MRPVSLLQSWTPRPDACMSQRRRRSIAAHPALPCSQPHSSQLRQQASVSQVSLLTAYLLGVHLPGSFYISGETRFDDTSQQLQYNLVVPMRSCARPFCF